MYRSLLLGTVFLITVLSTSAVAGSCLVTQAPSPAFIPPDPYVMSPENDGFWFGNERLWVRLPIVFSTRYGQKLFVWSKNFKGPSRDQNPPLVVTGRRLDADTEPFIAQDATHATNVAGGPAMLIGIDVPTTGCWELTAFYRGATIRFVVSVED